MAGRYNIGIDEVGRGALAGPVVVAALALRKGFNFNNDLRGRKPPLRDSKKLSRKQRGEWLKYLRSRKDVFFAAARVTPKVIDRINISEAANLAVRRALERLLIKMGKKNTGRVVLDGGLYIKKNKKKVNYLVGNGKRNFKIRTIVKADEKFPEVMLASIFAKVTRDRYMMKKAHKNYPVYGFLNHVGYGTKEHKVALAKYGLSDIHRKSFCRFIAEA
ncbi:MAG: hypothetical protein A2604_00005 [Candidatus Liptonbacteria bacterium RIFOXYD1_FULL_36_11]|uniref:Ribonuclease n=1 Tax=Candidatus Liptonbacteria bacterium RIFOXYD1_FULL_36_11 TaxID=1798656 RepID=A0A1G2CQV2_9BACT|nr:MAG: hypothetical protein A2604_00005 [Candidatus Liptonbacteria bacterium RIFOXYD1_FULL_36_11]